MNKVISNYDKTPHISFDSDTLSVEEGWENVTALIRKKIAGTPGKKIIVLDFYQGVNNEEIIPRLQQHLTGDFYFTADYMKPEDEIRNMVFPDVTNDEVFGYMTRLNMIDFFDAKKLENAHVLLQESEQENVYIYGPGAALFADKPDILIYLDMPRWEIQLRFRKNQVSNLGISNKTDKASLQYKHAFFVDWRVCDRHKRELMHKWDFVIDTTIPERPKIVDGASLNEAIQSAVHRPFRVVPFFDPGPWGGQWIKEYCDLDRNEKNYAWAFDCVPEENSLLFRFRDIIFEIPSINVVFAAPTKLLGEAVQARFGDEFPIRFDFLDTMQGGNLSLQVHPTTEYIREHFGMNYTQDESYYMLDTGDDAVVYLGFKDNIDPDKMLNDLRKAQTEGSHFEATDYTEEWKVKKHDHVLIPAGTIHCSGKNAMVLEISATPYIFTFKLWDWGRMGLDGKPRPINIEHGAKVLDWTRTPEYTKRELINTIKTVAEGDGWKEEYTGLHKREFIETRRHWFSKTVTHHTNGSVNVLNLVEGREAIVESPDNSFEPFIVHYAETFIIPENVKTYTIRPHGKSEGKECGTIKAFVRTNA
jgi:mannose-6-phosphate isomerase class I